MDDEPNFITGSSPEISPEINRLLSRAIVAALLLMPDADREAWMVLLRADAPPTSRATIADGWIEFTGPGLPNLRISLRALGEADP